MTAPESLNAEPASRVAPKLTFGRIVAGVLVLVVLIWLVPTIAALVAEIDFSDVSYPYAIVFGFVVLDAVIPIFPSESLLNAASTMAAQSDSTIDMWRVVLAGSLGAVVGDSILYWLARTVLRRFMDDSVAKAEQNPKVAKSMQVLSSRAPMVIVFGRFVPGLRFVVGATMGLARFPYPRFLLWDAIGGVFWATYTCWFSYLVATVIEDKPVISIAISAVVTTAILALLFIPLKRSWERAQPPLAVGDPGAEVPGAELHSPPELPS